MNSLLSDAHELSEFTSKDLIGRGHSEHVVAAAVQDGYLEVVGTFKSGKPGRPAFRLRLTRKGERELKRSA